MIAALVLLALVGGWELYARLGGVSDLILPAPSEVAQALWDDRALLWSNLLVTAQEVALGILVAAEQYLSGHLPIGFRHNHQYRLRFAETCQVIEITIEAIGIIRIAIPHLFRCGGNDGNAFLHPGCQMPAALAE